MIQIEAENMPVPFSPIAAPTVSYTYDPVYPRVSTMVDGTGTTTFNYNPVTGLLGSGRVGSVQTPLATISSTYDE